MDSNGKQWRVLIGSRSFGKAFPVHLEALATAGCEVIPNDVGRAYREAELLELLPQMDAIVTGTDELTAAVIGASPRLKTIAKHGVGLETIDLSMAQQHGVVVSATPGAIHDSVADLTMALILALARGIVPAHLETRRGGWKPHFGFELQGKILGIVGLGRIGKAVCRRAQGFGMTVIAVDPYADETLAAQQHVRLVSFEELIAAAHVVSLHLPAEAADGVLLGTDELARMRPGALLINTARGQLVDEDALAHALRSGHLGGAGIDAFVREPPAGSPLLELENVVLTPHIGGRTLDGQRRMGELVIENCLRALQDEEPLHRVV